MIHAQLKAHNWSKSFTAVKEVKKKDYQLNSEAAT